MTRIRATFATASVLALTAVLAGCGGDDALTAKEFRAQTTKLCEDAEKDTDKLGDELSAASDEDEVTKAIDKAVKRNRELIADIRDLKAPDSLSDDVDSMLDSVGEALDELDDATLEDLETMEDPFAEANEKANELGLDACAN